MRERDHGGHRGAGSQKRSNKDNGGNGAHRSWWAGLAVLALVLFPAPLAAQDRPATLSTLFEDIYGPRGLVLNSDDVQLDGSSHAAHFNSAFQSEFRLMNVALTSQLATVPLPSPASGFTYNFDSATGTFVRSTRSFGPILADRGETIGKGKIAFGYT